MTKEEILTIRDLVSVTVENLITTTAIVEQEVIIVNVLGKENRLYAEELWDRRNSCKDFIGYLKEKLGE